MARRSCSRTLDVKFAVSMRMAASKRIAIPCVSSGFARTSSGPDGFMMYLVTREQHDPEGSMSCTTIDDLCSAEKKVSCS